MKQWIKKLIEQFEVGGSANLSKTAAQISSSANAGATHEISEDRATLLYLLDVYNKNLFDTEKHPVRKTREIFDEFIKALLVASDGTRADDPQRATAEKVLFRLRQFFAVHRIDEYGYIQNTFEDFKGIIWDFADQLSEAVRLEKLDDKKIGDSLGQLREAVEANSIDDLRVRSREFIDFYVEQQTRRDERREKSLTLLKTNLDSVRKKLSDANQKIHIDHLTKAFNRLSFDEQIRLLHEQHQKRQVSASLIVFDLDHFKNVNDTFGHDVGDKVLCECVNTIKSVFDEPGDYLARTGGEEFAILLSGCKVEPAIVRAESALDKVRQHVVISGSFQVRFTISMGIAELGPNEPIDMWLKRADNALYESKNSGRDRYTVAPPAHMFAA